MEEEVRAAVFGNVGTMIVFRVGAYDAEVLEKEFMPQFTAEDIVNLGIYQTYLKLMIDGISSQAFSATTLPPIAKPESSSMKEVIEMSRKQFASPRADVEKKIDEWMAPIKPPQKTGGAGGVGGSGATAGASRPPLQTPVVSKPEIHVQQAPLPVNSHEVKVDHAHVAEHKTEQKVEYKVEHKVAPPPSVPKAVTKAPEVVQPFKKAFQEIKIEEKPAAQTYDQHISAHSSIPSRKPVSLDSLSQKSHPRSTVKQAQPERVNDLKNALASILKTAQQPMHTQPTATQSAESQHQNHHPHPREISEEKLREVLKVE